MCLLLNTKNLIFKVAFEMINFNPLLSRNFSYTDQY